MDEHALSQSVHRVATYIVVLDFFGTHQLLKDMEAANSAKIFLPGFVGSLVF
jgi:hypothetical protein